MKTFEIITTPVPSPSPACCHHVDAAIGQRTPRYCCSWNLAFCFERVVLARFRSPTAAFGIRVMASNRVLYWGSGSPPCWRVMAALDEKKLDYESKQISFSESKSCLHAPGPAWSPVLALTCCLFVCLIRGSQKRRYLSPQPQGSSPNLQGWSSGCERVHRCAAVP